MSNECKLASEEDIGPNSSYERAQEDQSYSSILDLCDNSSIFMRFMLKFFHNEMYSTVDDS